MAEPKTEPSQASQGMVINKRKASPDMGLDISMPQSAKQWCPTTNSEDVKPAATQQVLQSGQPISSEDIKPIIHQQYIPGQPIVHQQYPYTTPTTRLPQHEQYIPPSPIKATDYSSKTSIASGVVLGSVDPDSFAQSSLSSPIKHSAHSDLGSDAFPTHVIAQQDAHLGVVSSGGDGQLPTTNTQGINSSEALMFEPVRMIIS